MNLDLKNFCWRLFGTKQQVIYLEDLFLLLCLFSQLIIEEAPEGVPRCRLVAACLIVGRLFSCPTPTKPYQVF